MNLSLAEKVALKARVEETERGSSRKVSFVNQLINS